VVHLFRRETELGGATCPWPVEYARDVSVFVDPNVFSDEEFARVARASAGRGVESGAFYRLCVRAFFTHRSVSTYT
jgi:hypothetical protein